MSSVAQVEANRCNSQKSTGPRTPEGKARARLNAVTHGLLCDKAVIKGEDAGLFAEHCRSMKEALAPVGAMEGMLADRIAAQAWRLRRATGIEGLFLHRNLGRFGLLEDEFATGEARREASPPQPADPAAGEEEKERRRVRNRATFDFFHLELPKLDVLRRYERSIDLAMHQALRDLQSLQDTRRKAAPTALPAGRELLDAVVRDPVASGLLSQFARDIREQARREALAELAASTGSEASKPPAPAATPASVPAASSGKAQVLSHGQVTEAASGHRAPYETKPISGGASLVGLPAEDAGRVDEELEEALAAAAAGV